MGKKRMTTVPPPEQSLTWRISDDGMDLLERAGLAGLYMALRATRSVGVDLSPLTWREDDLQSDAVTVRWTGPAKSAFTKLMEWSWQVKDGVLLFPAIHGEREAARLELRVSSHNGIMRTFLQHVNSQPKLESVTRIVPLDEGQTVSISFEPPAERVDDLEREINPKTKRPHKKKVAADRVRPHEDLDKLFDSKGELTKKEVSLSNWLYPGIAGRYGDEQSWVGSAHMALPLMLAPTTCLYLRLQGEGNNWVVVIPDIHDLAMFAGVRPRLTLRPDVTDVASLGDAGLKYLAYATQDAQRRLSTGCRVIAMGYVGYYQGQSIRKAVLDVPAQPQAVARYRLLQRELDNQYVPLKAESALSPTDKSKRLRKKTTAQTTDPVPKPGGFMKIPSARGRIAENLVSGRPWYRDLAVPTRWELDELERTRKRNVQLNKADRGNRPTSHETILFQGLCYQRSKLMKLIAEDDMWDTEVEKVFVDAFWQALDALYAREGKATERGGSRTSEERFEDLNEDIRRRLMRAKTRTLLRSELSDLLAKAGRQKAVRNHPAPIWRLIDHPEHWQKGRDLALLALASHRKREVREGAATTDSNTTNPEGA